jgi:hypothetical protein
MLDDICFRYVAAEHGIGIVIKLQRIAFQRNGQLVGTARVDDSYAMDMRVVVPRQPAEINIATASENLQLLQERLDHQDKRQARKVLERMEISMCMAETGEFCDVCVLGKAHRKPSLNGRIDLRSSVS